MNRILFFAFSLLVIVSSCAVEKSSSTSWEPYDDSNGDFESRNKERMSERKMIYTATIQMDVKNVDSLQKKLYALVEEKEGFIVKSSTSSTTFRVYSDYLYPTISAVEKMGKVKHKNVVGSDVTDEHYDLNTRLENAQRARDRYLSLLDIATTVDEMLKVEKELERLNGELDLLQGKIERMDHLINFATIEVQYEKAKRPGIVGSVFVGVFKVVKWLFVIG